MNRFTAIVLTFLLVMSVFTPFALAQDYLLGPGDILGISVYGYEDLQIKDLIIRPDGKIAFPLVGELTAAGFSTGQLTTQLTKGIGEYLKDPKVTVNIERYRTTRVYVLGEIAKPGLYELEKQHNLLDAVSAAGGYTKDTAKKKVFIVKKDKPEQPLQVNLLDILQKGDLRQNHSLDEGDVVYLVHNGRVDFAKDILPFISGIYYLDRIKNMD